MLFTIKWLSTIFTSFQGTIADDFINNVSTDSREQLDQSLFIPLIGDRFDGHDYAKQAIDNGAKGMIWDECKTLPDFVPINFPVFFVANTLEALQQLAAYYRKEVNPFVIGITGSNGKTTTKDIVASVIKTTYRTHCTAGNLNNHIGVPLTILSMNRQTEMLVLEMGMNDFNEIDLLSKIAKPDIAIVTQIGESHIEFLGSREGIAVAKLEIINGFKEDGLLIIDGDEALLNDVHANKNVITCGYQLHNDIIIEHTNMSQTETVFTLENKQTYTIPLLGNHHVKNATYAIILGERLGISDQDIKEGLLHMKLTSMRFELLDGINGATIINDAYNASPSSMKAAIEVVKQMEGYDDKILVLGDVFELGDKAEQFLPIIAEVIDHPITAVYTYGENAKLISSAVKRQQSSIICIHAETERALLNLLQPYLTTRSLLLFKASRGMHFESLVEEVSP